MFGSRCAGPGVVSSDSRSRCEIVIGCEVDLICLVRGNEMRGDREGEEVCGVDSFTERRVTVA